MSSRQHTGWTPNTTYTEPAPPYYPPGQFRFNPQATPFYPQNFINWNAFPAAPVQAESYHVRWGNGPPGAATWNIVPSSFGNPFHTVYTGRPDAPHMPPGQWTMQCGQIQWRG